MALLMRFLAPALLMFLFGCQATSEKNAGPLPGAPLPGTESEIAGLEQALLALGPGVDPLEAAAAAQASYRHTHDLAIEYEITDRPLVHNVKVNMGIKPRGLCKDWAHDMEHRLKAEQFETLTIHRAIGTLFGLDHSTAVITRKGDSIETGIVVDPWREGGRLTWISYTEDTKWGWEPQFKVLDRIAFEDAKRTGKQSVIFTSEAGAEPRCLTLIGTDDYAPSTTDLSACQLVSQ